MIHGTTELISSCDNNKHDISVREAAGNRVSHWQVFQGVLYVWGGDASHASTTVLWCVSHKDVNDEIMADPLNAHVEARKQRRAGLQDHRGYAVR